MLGEAAVAIWCNVASEVRDDFDDWHTHEHMPERLSISGFRRGSRWAATDASGGYFMLYEALSETSITSGPYVERLNDPTPWSRKMMPHHRNMVRSLCRVDATFGAGLGQALLTVRFSPRPHEADRLTAWLTKQLLPRMPARKGLVAAHLLRNIAREDAAQTTEQKLRGGDSCADWVVLVTGYHAAAVGHVAAEEMAEAALVARGAAPGSITGLYRLAYVLSGEN